MAIHITEIKYSSGGADNFVEISVPAGTDVSGYTIVFYDKNGSIDSTSSLGTQTTSLAGNDIYLADMSTPGFFDMRSDDAVAIVDDLGNVIEFVSFEGHTVSPTTGPAAGLTSTSIGDGSGGGTSLETHDGGATYFAQATPNPGVVCFTPGALIDTPDGKRPVESLAAGDLVLTADNGPQAIRWISRRDIAFGDDMENARPIEIKAGAFAPGLPARTMIVSPQHRFVFLDLREPRPVEVFVAAKALIFLPKVRVMRGKRAIRYIHFVLEQHEVVFAEGVRTESCHLGPLVLQDIPRRKRRQIGAVFPRIDFDRCSGYGPTARPVLKVQHARRLLSAGQLVSGGRRNAPGREFAGGACLFAEAGSLHAPER